MNQDYKCDSHNRILVINSQVEYSELAQVNEDAALSGLGSEGQLQHGGMQGEVQLQPVSRLGALYDSIGLHVHVYIHYMSCNFSGTSTKK